VVTPCCAVRACVFEAVCACQVGEGQGKEAEAAVDPAGVGRVREARGQEVEEMGAGTLRELSFHGCLQGVRWRQMEVEGMR